MLLRFSKSTPSWLVFIEQASPFRTTQRKVASPRKLIGENSTTQHLVLWQEIIAACSGCQPITGYEYKHQYSQHSAGKCRSILLCRLKSGRAHQKHVSESAGAAALARENDAA
jgi:hypothetical protein